MASLANQTISSTYDGLIKTSTDQPVPATGVQLLEDGLGNSLSVSIGRVNNGIEVSGTVTATAFVGDGSGLTGISVSPTLDEVTTNGATTTNSITVGNVTATSFIKSGGTSAQFLKADGSVDSNTYLTSFTETNDLTAAVVWANVPDANITQTSVTQHQAALSITESQISDLQSYLTAESDTLDSVTGRGASTTNAVTVGGATVNGNLSVTGTIADSSGDVGTSGQILSSTGTGTNWIAAPTGGGGTTYTIQEISTNTTAQKDYLYVMRASLTLTLPASPSVGDKVAVANMSGTITPVVARNGNLIAGLAEDMTIDVDSISVEFIYSGANEGWILFVDSILGYTSTTNVNGSGTTNYISKWSDADTLTDSVIYDDGTNVGIGTSSPARKLDVNGDIRSNTQLVLGTDNAGSNTAFVKWQGVNASNPNQNTLGLFTWGDSPAIQIGGGATIFKVESFVATERARIDNDGLKFNGDTAAANALDDYEEGTWTPVVRFGGNSVGISYVAQTGSYTKIGNKVTVTAYFKLSNKGSSTGNATIAGLPFTLANFSAISIGYLAAITFADFPLGLGESSSTIVSLAETTNSGVQTALTNGNFANNSELIFSLTYFT